MRNAMPNDAINRRNLVQQLTVGLASPWFALAQEAPEKLRIGESELEVTFAGVPFDLPRSDLVQWVRQCARAVAGYFGRFPVARAGLTIISREGRQGVAGGRTWGGGAQGAHTRISVGQHATAEDLRHDWVLTHEFVHYGFPDVADRHHWIEEGIATYVEPIARVAIGTQDPATAWFEMLRDMPKGQPQDGDEGLDNTHSWGRTYWGGAMFCLLADVNIRKSTGNRKGLRDALRAIVAAGGSIEVHWPIERALEVGDKAVGGTPLMSLYEQMAGKPTPVDLNALWRELGVERRGDRAVFDDRAPLAAIRRGIMDLPQPSASRIRMAAPPSS